MIVKDELSIAKVSLTGAQRAQLEERLQRGRQATARTAEPRVTIPRRTTNENLPLSFAQERLWFLDQLEPGSAAYNLCQAVRMQGTLDVPALERALNEIIRRHEVLRTNFVAADGAGIQIIAPGQNLKIHLVDLSTRSRPAEELMPVLQEEARRPFDLAVDLLLRAMLVRTSGTEYTLMLTMHHIISDGWSIGVMFRELGVLYAGFCRNENVALPELPIQFADFVLWDRDTLRGPALEKPLAYWKHVLAGSLPVLELPLDHPRLPGTMPRAAVQSVQLARPLAQGLKALGQREGSTLFMTLLCAFQILLHRWTDQEDLLIGSVVAGRRKVELEKLIGFFVSTFVLRGDLSGQPTFRELLERVRESVLGALAHQELPFEELVKALRPDRMGSQNPLFQVMFVLQNAPMTAMELPGLVLEPVEVNPATAKFDLMLTMQETSQGLGATFEYNSDLFEAGTIARLLEGFQILLAGIVATPEGKIGDLPIVSAAEREQLVETWNATGLSYDRGRCVHHLFEDQVRRIPGTVAVVGETSRLTYGDLDRRAEDLAARLRAEGVGPDARVGIFLERTPDLLVGLLGVLKAGGAYVPLDPAYPPERLAYIVGHAQLSVLVTQRTLADQAPPGCRVVIEIDRPVADLPPPTTAPLPHPTSASLAYVIYTSGSTGRPKGVAVEHRSVVALCAWARTVYSTEELAGLLASTSACFDVSVFEMFVPLAHGGTVVLAENILQLPTLAAAREVTMISSVPSAIGALLRQNGIPPSVRTVNLAGEPCPQSLVDALYRQPHITRVLDLYGPTETTVYSTCALRQAGGRPTIGRPLANEQVYILDRARRIVPVGVPGELYLGGEGLARGYLHEPGLTAERFVTDPLHPGARLYRTGDRVRYRADGNIEFLGRLDHQVKLRGYRIELGEIESVLRRHPGLADCAVMVRFDQPDDPRLVAYVVPLTPGSVDLRDVRVHLQQQLPEYMVPSAILELARLPQTPNGKIDLKALPAIDGTRTDAQGKYVGPTDEVERQLVAIWEEILGVQPIGVQDRFFDLGGHSLLAVRMIAQIERKFGKKLPLAAIFQHRTVEELARLLRVNGQRYTSATSVVEIQGHGQRTPLYFVHGIGGGMFWGYANLARHLGTEQPVYAFKSRGLDELPEWGTIEQMAASYVTDLRAHRPQGPYLLGGYCFGGIVAYEMARQLQAQGQEVGLLALINCSPPNTDYFQPRHRGTPAWQIKFLRNLGYWGLCFIFRWSFREQKEFVRWKLRLVQRRASAPEETPVEGALTDLDEMLNLADYSDRQRELWQTHARTLHGHHPQPYAGAVTLFRTRGHPLFCSFDDNYGWSELARGGVEIRGMPGGHGSILDEPHVRAVAQSLQSCLGAAEARQSTARP